MNFYFNKDQKEGLAKFLDSLSAASIIGVVVGSTSHSTITTLEIFALAFVAVVMLGLSLYLRKHIPQPTSSGDPRS